MRTAMRTTWTFQPEPDVQSLLSKAVNRRVGRTGRKHGLRTSIINEAIRQYLADLRGKREMAS